MIRLRSSKPRRRTSERAQRLILVAAMVGLFGAILMLGREVVTEARQTMAAQNIAERQREPQDEKVYTGSILFMPHVGNTCRQYLFDNITGRLSDNGMVDCQRGEYHSDANAPKKWSAARVHVISSGFRDH
jgi:hypothetical protein